MSEDYKILTTGQVYAMRVDRDSLLTRGAGDLSPKFTDSVAACNAVKARFSRLPEKPLEQKQAAYPLLDFSVL